MTADGQTTSAKSCSNKACPCENPQPLEAFTREARSKDGRAGRCKTCQKAYRETHKDEIKAYKKTHHELNHERVNARRAQYRRENPQKIREQKQVYYEKNRDSVLARVARWQGENKEHKRVYLCGYYTANAQGLKTRARKNYLASRNSRRITAKRYFQANRETFRAYKHARRSRERGAGGSYTASEWKARLQEFSHCCFYCGEELTGVIHRDHFIPVDKGGSSYIHNIVPACAVCNLRKFNKLPEEFIALLELEGRTPSLPAAA